MDQDRLPSGELFVGRNVAMRNHPSSSFIFEKELSEAAEPTRRVFSLSLSPLGGFKKHIYILIFKLTGPAWSLKILLRRTFF